MEDRDPDLELWQQAVHDARAFDRLRQKYRQLVRGEMRKRVADLKEEDLQDLEQSVWIAVNTSLPTFKGHSRFSTWLVGIGKNVLLTWLRRQRVERAAIPRHYEDTDTSDATARLLETLPAPALEPPVVEAIVIEGAMKNLKERERLVIHFRYEERLTDEEMAIRMNLPLGTVKSHLRSALRKLRQDAHLWEAFMEGMPT